jgi:poly-gamma-glutamate synthesis protein (capsule biosynthesis protein)
MENEELNRRRARRQELQAQRRKQQKALMLKLIIAAAVLVVSVAAVVIVSLSRPQPKPQPTEPAPTQTQPQITEDTQPPQTQPPETEPPMFTEAPVEEGKRVIHFIATGDLNITDNVVASGGESQNYGPAFMDILPLLSSGDLTVVNLEGNVIGAPYGSAYKSAPQSMLVALKRAGVDLIQMANSCSIYNGVAGLSATLDAIQAAGLQSVGAFRNRDEFRRTGGYTIREVNGIKIAVVGFTKGMDSMGLPSGSEDCVNVLYKDYDSTYQKVDSDGIKSVLKAVAEDKPDITIALVHWGSEFNDKISPSQQTIENLLLDNGVDAIIGTHSHFVQQMKLDRDKGTFVAYSLGDFFGDGERAGTEYSVVLDLKITKDLESGDTRVEDFSYTPIFTVHEADKPLRVVRIAEAMQAFEHDYVNRVSQETYDAMVYALKRIEARIKGE